MTLRTPASQNNVADYRNIFQRSDGVSAMNAGRSWENQVERCLRCYHFAAEFCALMMPVSSHHFRQAINDDVQETAYHQANERNETDE